MDRNKKMASLWHNGRVLSVEEALDALEATTIKTAVFYSRDGLLTSAESGQLDFVNTLCSQLLENGFRNILVDGTKLNRPLEPENSEELIHIWMIEQPPSGRLPSKMVFCFPSYLRGRWYFDSIGIRNNSSIRIQEFRPHKMHEGWSNQFFDLLRKRFVERGFTKFEQCSSGSVNIPNGCITLAAQTFSKPKKYPTFIDYPELIEQTLKSRGRRPVVVKPHPLSSIDELIFMRSFHNPDNGVFVDSPNLHELLAKTDIVVTRCSAVALEAMLHEVPAVVCGQVDFHHCVTTLVEVTALEAAIEWSLRRDVPYKKYLTWLFSQQLVNAEDPKVSRAKISATLARNGVLLDQFAKAGYAPCG